MKTPPSNSQIQSRLAKQFRATIARGKRLMEAHKELAHEFSPARHCLYCQNGDYAGAKPRVASATS